MAHVDDNTIRLMDMLQRHSLGVGSPWQHGTRHVDDNTITSHGRYKMVQLVRGELVVTGYG